MHTALCLERLLRRGEATVMVADPHPYMTYQPLLAEAAAGNLEPRHVVVPLRSAFPFSLAPAPQGNGKPRSLASRIAGSPGGPPQVFPDRVPARPRKQGMTDARGT